MFICLYPVTWPVTWEADGRAYGQHPGAWSWPVWLPDKVIFPFRLIEAWSENYFPEVRGLSQGCHGRIGEDIFKFWVFKTMALKCFVKTSLSFRSSGLNSIGAITLFFLSWNSSINLKILQFITNLSSYNVSITMLVLQCYYYNFRFRFKILFCLLSW